MLWGKRYLSLGGQAHSLRHSWSSLTLKPTLKKLTVLTWHSNLQLQVYFRFRYNSSTIFPTFACTAFSHMILCLYNKASLLLKVVWDRFLPLKKKILLVQNSCYIWYIDLTRWMFSSKSIYFMVTNNNVLEVIKFDNFNSCAHSFNPFLLNIYYIHGTESDTGN